MLSSPYNAKNYAGIIDTGLLLTALLKHIHNWIYIHITDYIMTRKFN